MGEFTFQGQGTLQRIDTFVSKAGKTILTLICETQGQYPQLVPIKVFGRLAEQASAWKPGSVLSVSGRLGGRDWQGKVYGDIVANPVEVVSEGVDPTSVTAADAMTRDPLVVERGLCKRRHVDGRPHHCLPADAREGQEVVDELPHLPRARPHDAE